jgi:pyruvate-formate lyase-activating enzyme
VSVSLKPADDARPASSLSPAKVESEQLRRVTEQPFEARTPRHGPFRFGGFTTTEVCNLSCVMCHFNGPDAVKKATTMDPGMVRRVLDQIPAGSHVHFAGTGDFFMDPHAVDHLRYAVGRGLRPLVLSHGQLYTPELLEELLRIGIRDFRISCDAIDPVQYAKIRRGGELQNILDAVEYLNGKRGKYPDIKVEINCTLFRKTFPKQAEFEAFWAGKVDAVHFNAEYFDTWHFRNLHHLPTERSNCVIQTYILPSGKIAPCCAVMVHAHDNNVDWLPSVSTHTLEEAYNELCDMYENPESPLAKLCRRCEWWILWAPPKEEATPYYRVATLPPVPAPSEPEPDSVPAHVLSGWGARLGRALSDVVGKLRG